MKPSNRVVLTLLRANPEGLTSRIAWLEGGCSRLAARISELKAEGYDIDSELVTLHYDGRSVRVAAYRLREQAQLRMAL